MSVRSAPILRSWKLRRVGGLLACSLAVGSVLTVGICWMAAWDEYIPSPRGLAQGRFIYDADYLGIGKSGEGRPAPLQWWEALTPSSWRVGPRVWPEDKYKKRVAIPELSGEAKVEHLVHWQVIWRMGPGLTDSFSVEKVKVVDTTLSEVPPILELSGGGWFEGSPLAPSELPRGLIGRGIPGCVAFSMETRRAWHELSLPAWAVLNVAVPSIVLRLGTGSTQRVPLALPGSGFSESSEFVIEEVRAYGWPLRSLVTRGWRRTLLWRNASFHKEDEVYEWWSDGLGDMRPLDGTHSAQLRLPATGLPWKPLWLPFLANSLILGVPLTLAGFGASQAARWGFAKFRGRGDRCPKCGYSREGLARNSACPECGECRKK